jgi:hypothetical protein
VGSFKTSKGSTYASDKGSTQRNKALHVGHDSKDVGMKEKSARTFYASPEDAVRIGAHMGMQGTTPRVVHQGGKIHLLSRNSVTGKIGQHGKPLEISHDPEVGRAPVEVWAGGKIHPGNPITEVNHGDTARDRDHGDKAQRAPSVPPDHHAHAQAVYGLADSDMQRVKRKTDGNTRLKSHVDAEEHGQARAIIREHVKTHLSQARGDSPSSVERWMKEREKAHGLRKAFRLLAKAIVMPMRKVTVADKSAVQKAAAVAQFVRAVVRQHAA